MKDDKILIYQVLPRLLGNTNSSNIKNGSIDQNGSGKFNDITTLFLEKIKKDGYTHIWLIGVLAHASTTDYSSYGIPKGFPEIIKGKAGSPYAVRDYYDVNPDLAVDVENRIGEFDSLINRIHSMGMKVIIDFIPNHLARNYKSINRPNGVVDFGENDNIDVSFSPQNNFYYLPNQSLKLN
ncbi:MAG: alpha-amylase, partial [Proteiniphilum sp.]|nr:alpha-amylase [Proteiniphilum sp.]